MAAVSPGGRGSGRPASLCKAASSRCLLFPREGRDRLPAQRLEEVMDSGWRVEKVCIGTVGNAGRWERICGPHGSASSGMRLSPGELSWRRGREGGWRASQAMGRGGVAGVPAGAGSSAALTLLAPQILSSPRSGISLVDPAKYRVTCMPVWLLLHLRSLGSHASETPFD